jgi:hypothetical protein
VPVTLVALAAAPVTTGRSLPVAVAAAGAVGVLVLARAARIAQAAASWSVAGLARALAVAATYEFARASAIVTRAGHHRDGAAAQPRPAGVSAAK